MELPSVRQLLVALDIERSRSISGTADSIPMSQSAVSQALKKLEALAGQRLFERTTAGVYPTAEGIIFLQRGDRARTRLQSLAKLAADTGNQDSTALMRRLTNADLRCFLATVESGSFRLAAARLALTQPTVHRAVANFEALCGCRFFRRSPFGVEPDWRARQIARLAGVYFRELEQALEAVREEAGEATGYLRLGALPLVSSALLPDAVNQLLGEFPRTRVQIVDGPYDEQLSRLLHGRLDLIIGALRDPAPGKDIVQTRLFEEPLNVILRADHPMIGRQKPPRTSDLRQLAWITPREGTPARVLFNRLFERHGLTPPDDVIECNSTVAVRGLLLGSDRAALLSAKQVEVDIRKGLLAALPGKLPGTERDIGITALKNGQPTAVQRRFVALLQQHCQPPGGRHPPQRA